MTPGTECLWLEHYIQKTHSYSQELLFSQANGGKNGKERKKGREGEKKERKERGKERKENKEREGREGMKGKERRGGGGEGRRKDGREGREGGREREKEGGRVRGFHFRLHLFSNFGQNGGDKILFLVGVSWIQIPLPGSPLSSLLPELALPGPHASGFQLG